MNLGLPDPKTAKTISRAREKPTRPKLASSQKSGSNWGKHACKIGENANRTNGTWSVGPHHPHPAKLGSYGVKVGVFMPYYAFFFVCMPYCLFQSQCVKGICAIWPLFSRHFCYGILSATMGWGSLPLLSSQEWSTSLKRKVGGYWCPFPNNPRFPAS